MGEKHNIILNQNEIDQKIRRIAYQILETNSDEQKIVLAGIADNGYIFAEKLKQVLEQIAQMEIIMCKVKVDKKNPLQEIVTQPSLSDFKNQTVVLIDDVLNSGSTLIYATKHFLNVELKKLQTAVLIDRSHKRFPVKADFKGLSLSTSLNEHVEVLFEKSTQKALLY